MSRVPTAAVLANWVNALWRGDAGGDDLLELLVRTGLDPILITREGPIDLLPAVNSLRRAGCGFATAYCLDAGVDLLPGPKAVTEAAVAGGQAVVLHGPPAAACTVLTFSEHYLRAWEGLPPRPVWLDVRSSSEDLSEAILQAESALRQAPGAAAALRGRIEPPQPAPGTSPEAHALIARSARMWDVAAAGIEAGLPHPELHALRRTAARACLTGYAGDPRPIVDRSRQPRAAEDAPW